ncbi:MAG: hypothetical protein J6T14_03580 [Clostridia bacterium]|nr:hypothetical protein [Clostridia bacterium]MBO7689901.1 hypothetical protein [Clostridia bacterium]MBP5273051.1 hypothetical protein [Clostridia bacterium]MBP5459943.1 hypothetical protein [Clostridia bacterium]
MDTLKNLFSGIAALRDWQEEVDRAYKVSELYRAESPESYSRPKGPGHECLILDLTAYRASRTSA